MNGSRSTTDAAAAVRHLSASLPYTRLFGAQFSFGEEAGSFRCVGRRTPELEQSGHRS